MEYLKCNFSDKVNKNEGLNIDETKIGRSRNFRYLNSIDQDDRELIKDVTNRIKTSWVKQKGASRVLYDCRMPFALKDKFYRTVVRPALMYGSEYWVIQKQYTQKMGVAEMRMLRWMLNVIRKDQLRHKLI